ncbi:MAG: C-terminal target protein [Paenibacillaceae bacterium]|jgi:hypothetical protein|nr:C-terminal target protein [Paenibacillaceae bacterium]
MDKNRKQARRAARRGRGLLSLLLAFAVLWAGVAPYGVEEAGAEAAGLLKETFDSTPAGMTPPGWSVSATGSSSVSVQETVYGDHHLAIYDASKQKTEGVTAAFPAQTGKVTVEAQFKLPAGGTAGKENMLFYLLDSANRQAVSLVLNPVRIDSIRTTPSGTTSTTVASALPLHEWRSIIIEADVTAKTFNFYLDGVLKQTGVPFRNDDVVNVAKLQVAGAYYSDNAYYIRTALLDNVRIYEGEAQLPAPPDLVEEGFQSIPAGTAPEGWGVTAAGASYVQVEESANGNRYLHIHDASKQASQGINKSFTPQTGLLTVQADIQLPAGATPGKENILFYLLDSANRPAAALILKPDAILTLQTSGGVTTTTQAVGGLPLHAWRSLAIAADYNAKTFDLYLNGAIVKSGVPFRYNDVQNIAKLQVAGAYYSDDAYYTRQANLDNIRIYSGLPDIQPPEPVVPPEPGVERYSFDSYSSVFLSSRWYREDGQDGQLGTLDVLKRFMVTDDKWTYLTDPVKISDIVRQGVSFQGALNTNLGTNEGRAKYFDGTSIVAPWMTWGATWGSVHDPVYYELALRTGKQIIDAGASGIQFDDWAGGVAANQFGGDFCEASMVQFREYLKETYSGQQLADWGISDIDSFHYKTYLQTRYNIYTNVDYAGSRGQSPLNDAFIRFQYLATVDFHQRLYSDLLAYAGRPFDYSNNAPFIQNPAASANYLHDLFSYGMGESSEAILTLDNIVANGQFATGLGSPHIISPLPQNDMNIRQAITAAYATGQYVLVPWDVWLHGSTRYFGTVQEYGDLYHFIRQYPFLFDGYEMPAKVGIVIKWEEANFLTLKELSMKLFEAGVPFRDIIVHTASPQYELAPEQLEGLDGLIAYTPLDHLSQEQQQIIEESELPVYSPEDSGGSANWLAERQSVEISGDGSLYATLRATDNPDAPKVVHLLSRSPYTAEDAVVALNDQDFFGGEGIEAVLYRPGHNPETLALSDTGDGRHTVVIPQLREWGILRIRQTAVPGGEPFKLPAPWSGISIGNPVKEGAAWAPSGSPWLLTSDGEGFGLQLRGDNGFSDQLAYAYQHLEATPLQDFALTAGLGAMNGTGEYGRTGLMVRETPASNAKFVAVTYDRNGTLKLLWREADNGPLGVQELGTGINPGYVKLERQAGAYRAYYSEDGVEWGAALGTYAGVLDARLGGVFAADTGEAGIAVSHAAASYGALSLPSGELTGLRISSMPEHLRTGETAQLSVTAVVYENQIPVEIDVTREHISYTSSNEAILAVDPNGIARGLAEGGATVSASFTAGETTVSASVYLEVLAPSPYLVQEDFDRYAAGDTPEGWSFIPVNAGGSFIQIAELPSTSDRSLQIYDNTPSGFPSASVSFAPQTAPLVAEMDFRINLGAVKQAGGAIVAYLQAGGSASAVSLLVDSTGFWYLDGSTPVTVAPVVEDEWSRIRIVADPTTEKMDLFINEVQVVSQGNFRTSTGVISKLQVGGSTTGSDTTAYWNNIRIYSVTE